MFPDDSTRRGGGRGGAFHRRLQALKQQGSALLVVGEVTPFVWVEACERLLGEGDELPRQRLLTLTGSERSVRARLDDHHTGGLGSTKALTTGIARSASAQAPTHPEVPVIDLEYDSLDELAGAISGWIQETAAIQGSLAPAELRLCVDSLLPLLDEHGEEAVFDFVALTAARARAVAGMAHYHLGVERDAEIVDFLRPAVDAMVELRIGSEGTEQRWLLDEECRSEWFAL